MPRMFESAIDVTRTRTFYKTPSCCIIERGYIKCLFI